MAEMKTHDVLKMAETWNDNPDRKKREVVDLLLEAARAEEEADG